MGGAASSPKAGNPCYDAAKKRRFVSDTHWCADIANHVLPDRAVLPCWNGCSHESFYLRMDDGALLAVDVCLPAGASKVPAVVHQTRYSRALRLRWPLSALGSFGRPEIGVDPTCLFKTAFLAAGYAVVTCDVRGCGASSGVWPGPNSPREVQDSSILLSWIVGQRWADGRVVLWGVSYDAMVALSTLAASAPDTAKGSTGADPANSVRIPRPIISAVVAIAPFWDIYRDIGVPGGIPLHGFFSEWSGLLASLDARDHRRLFWPLSAIVPACVVGPTRPKGIRESVHDSGRDSGAVPASPLPDTATAKARVRAARAQHAANACPLGSLQGIRYVDDPVDRGDGGATVPGRQASLSAQASRLRSARTPIYFYAGTCDSAARGALAAWAALTGEAGDGSGHRLTLGPWTHLLTQHIGAGGRPSRWTRFEHVRETLAFMVAHCPPRSASGPPASPAPEAAVGPSLGAITPPYPGWGDAAVHYFVQGAGWRSTNAWPPPGAGSPRVFYLQPAPLGTGPVGCCGTFMAVVSAYGRGLPAAAAGGLTGVATSCLVPVTQQYVTLPPPCPDSPPPIAGVTTVVATRSRGPAVRGRTRWETMLRPLDLLPRASGLPLRSFQGSPPAALCFTSAPLDSDVTLSGCAIASLWISCSRADADIFVYLEDVGPSRASGWGGRGSSVTEGCLRTSLRAEAVVVGEGESDVDSAAWVPGGVRRRFQSADVACLVPRLDAPPVLMRVELMPAFHVFKAGRRLRICLAGADGRRFDSRIDGVWGREIAVHAGGAHAASIALPLAPPDRGFAVGG